MERSLNVARSRTTVWGVAGRLFLAGYGSSELLKQIKRQNLLATWVAGDLDFGDAACSVCRHGAIATVIREPDMHEVVSRFLRYLNVERNASDLTIKSYREDLTSLAEFLQADRPQPPQPSEIGVLDLRGYVSALHEAGYAKSSVARRLASMRSFLSSHNERVTRTPIQPSPCATLDLNGISRMSCLPMKWDASWKLLPPENLQGYEIEPFLRPCTVQVCV